MLGKFRNFARDVMPSVDHERKLFGMLVGVFTAGITAGFTIGTLAPNLSALYSSHQSERETPTIDTHLADNCDTLLKDLPKIQATYDAQLKPLQMRWLEITKELERGDLLFVERKNKAEVEKMVRQEIDDLQNKHHIIVSEMSNNCLRR